MLIALLIHLFLLSLLALYLQFFVIIPLIKQRIVVISTRKLLVTAVLGFLAFISLRIITLSVVFLLLGSIGVYLNHARAHLFIVVKKYDYLQWLESVKKIYLAAKLTSAAKFDLVVQKVAFYSFGPILLVQPRKTIFYTKRSELIFKSLLKTIKSS